MPTSSTAKLRAANKQVNLPGKTSKGAGKKVPPAKGGQEALAKHIEDKDASDVTSPTTETCPDANIAECNDSSDPVHNPESVQPIDVAAVVKDIQGADAEPPLAELPTSIAEHDFSEISSEIDSKIKHAAADLESPSKEEVVMGNSASSKRKDAKNTTTEKTVSSGDGKSDLESLPKSLATVDSVAKESVGLTEVVASFKMPNIPDLTKPAPDFCGQAVVDGQFKEIKLSDYKGKYVVLFFYPLDFTFVCPTEIISFSDRADDFRKVNCEVIACSTDSQYSHFAWVSTSRKQGGLGALNIPLLADKTCQIAKDYGCFKEDEGIAFRGLYIIDDKGRLRQITINDLPVGRSVDEALRLVQAFQFTDKYGEVCPAGWKPGDKTMKPDPTGSKEYFQDKH